jgi:serine/threonine-protein kinase
VLTAPALFGEMALITQAPRTATVIAEDEVRVLKLTREGFDELVRRHPQVGDFLTRAVGERLLESGSIQRVGKYSVVGRLGAGAVATVFEAINEELGRPVALKMLSHALIYHHGFRDQFQKEAQLIASLDHDHIVRVYDTEREWGTHFIVMEKLDGVTLDDLIQTGTKLAWGAVRRILRETATALAYSHSRGLLHRDIKPSNVFLTSEDRRVKLLDFGIAISPEASEARKGDQLFGTPYYMSPEQILGQRLDGRSDLYSLGIMAYELIAHEVPFDAETIEDLWRKHLYAPTPDLRTIVADVPEDLVEFVWRATAKRASERFASCQEAVQFLKTAAELPTVRGIELTTLAVSYHPSRRHIVQAALEQLYQQLHGIEGIAMLSAQQNSEVVHKE